VAPGRARENRGGVRERNKQDCVEADRTEAPAGGFGDGGGASSAEEEHAEQEQGPSSFRSSPFDEELSDSWGDDDEQGRFFFMDTCEDQQLGGWERRSRGRTASSSENMIEINRMFDIIFVQPSLSCLGYIY